jgi:endo-1,4-beta-xylanase
MNGIETPVVTPRRARGVGKWDLRKLPVLAAITLALPARAAEPSDREILAGADARIEKCRKADVVLTINMPDGRPAKGIEVSIEQTRHAFLFGSNIFMLGKCRTPGNNQAYEKYFSELLNYATAPFYWWGYESREGRPDYAATDRIIDWCRPRGIRIKGHPLMWNYIDPKWLPDDPAEVRRLQLARIRACVERFAGRIDMWDVVNEATEFERPHILKNAPKLTTAAKDVGKMEFVREAFETARAAHPKATLLINDYITDARYADEVISKLVDRNGKPLYDVIGIQCHQHGGAWTAKRTWEICERFAKFGVPLHFTEATILSGQLGWDLCATRPAFQWPSTPEGEERQAREVVRFYTVLFSHPAVEAITWWDFVDGGWQNAPGGFLRRDFTPKPAYHALLGLVKDKWWTRMREVTDPAGQIRLRGFCGDYRAKYAVDGRAYDRTFVVKRGMENRVEFRVGG